MGAPANRVRCGSLAWRIPLAVCLLVPQSAFGQSASEYEIKAAFLLNFTKFVEWPSTAFAAAESSLAICILAKDPFGRTLDDLVQGEAVNGRKIEVRRLSDLPQPRACQVVFVGLPEKDLSKTLSSLGPGVLSVGEGESFIRNGGIIGFVIEKRRVRFDINQAAAERAGLKLSSRLLGVARSVEGARP